jgi:hypothetical protein
MLVVEEQDMVAYRNGVYQGPSKGGMREGYGMMFFDTSELVIGHFKENVLCGPYLYFSSKLIFYGHCQNGRLSGDNVMIDQRHGRLVRGNFLNGRMVGEYSLIDLKFGR